ncbi:MAG: DMT family transporter [Clostridia bacterium]|jgi:drug/metabolite transporter (DMT)-like permease|nr:DMT family transporter [Clostridia bacterium]
MTAGIIAGITWAIASYILTLATGMEAFSAESLLFVTFISTFIHDASSAVWATAYNGVRGNLKNVWNALTKTKSGKWVVVAAVIGGPVGMTGYVMALTYMGASVGAVASAVFPAIGAILAYIFLKEKMKWYQWVFLIFTLLGVYGLSYSPELDIQNFALGIVGAAMCAFGWGIEAVILAKCLTDPEVKDEYALQIRQTTSALTYAVIILPVIKGWGFTANLFTPDTKWLIPTIVIAGLFATLSYLYYYKAISQIGASKAMALNVTYCAWIAVIPLALVIFGGAMPTFSALQIICTVVVLVCGIFAAADFKEIFKKGE